MNDATLIARGGDIRLLDAQNLTSSWSKSSKTGFGLGGGDGFFSFYGTESKKQIDMSSTSAGSQVASSSGVSIAAGRDVVMIGARVSAGGDLGVSAGRDVNILAGENTTYSATGKKSEGAGVGALLSLEKLDFFAGYQSTASGRKESASKAAGSVLTAGNDMSILAGNNINIEAGRLTAGHDVGLAAGNDVNLLQGENVKDVSSYKSQLRAGLNLTLTQNLTSNAQKTYAAARSAVDGSQGAAASAESGLNAAKGAAGVVGSQARASLTLGASGSGSTSSETKREAVPTEIKAGHDAAILAGNDITMQGTRLTAGNDALLAAGRDINILAAVSSSSTESGNSNFSAGVGIGAQASATGGASYGITAEVALGGGRADSRSVTRRNAEITAGGALSTLSGRDTTLAGANLLADQISMYVGRNLLVASVKDSGSSSEHSWNAGGSVTIGMGAAGNVAGGNLGYNTKEGRSDLINRQSSIIGISGVNIYTENNTHLRGALIAALNNNLVLNTGTLSFEDMTGSKTETGLSLGLTANYKWGGKTENASAQQAGADSGGTGASKEKEDTSYRPDWWNDLMKRQKAAAKDWKAFKEAAVVAPGAFSYSFSGTEQTARATVGPGTIIVRGNPGMDLSGLNRDIFQALITEDIPGLSFSSGPLFGYVDEALGAPEQIDAMMEIWDSPKAYIDKKLGRNKDTPSGQNAGGGKE